jgi:hypothetical protein
LDDVQLSNLISGLSTEPVHVGSADRTLARLLGCRRGAAIFLSNYNYTKIKLKHPNASFEFLVRIPSILRNGFVFKGNTAAFTGFCLIEVISGKLVAGQVVVKRSTPSELFVATAFPIKLKEARRIYRKAKGRKEVLRDQTDELAQRELRYASSP